MVRGQTRFFRQRTRLEAASIEAKTLFDYLVSQIRQRREVSHEEALLVAQDTMRYLDEFLEMRKLGQIEFLAVAGEGAHFRRRRARQAEKLVKLTIIDDDHASVLGEFGAAGDGHRPHGEGDIGGALPGCNAGRGQAVRAVPPERHRHAQIGKIIDQGATLPLAGLSRATRSKWYPRHGFRGCGRPLKRDTAIIASEGCSCVSRSWQTVARLKEFKWGR